MTARQVEWRRAHLASRDWGWQNEKQHEWILPQRMWEAGLYPGIRSDAANSLPAYLDAEGIQRHAGSHNLKSSWMLCANLYFPFRASAEGLAPPGRLSPGARPSRRRASSTGSSWNMRSRTVRPSILLPCSVRKAAAAARARPRPTSRFLSTANAA